VLIQGPAAGRRQVSAAAPARQSELPTSGTGSHEWSPTEDSVAVSMEGRRQLLPGFEAGLAVSEPSAAEVTAQGGSPDAPEYSKLKFNTVVSREQSPGKVGTVLQLSSAPSWFSCFL
jgi:hypothetical protein